MVCSMVQTSETAPVARYHADLVAAVIAGSATAFAMIYDSHASEVLAFLRRRCVDSAEAEDCFSIVFLEAWRTHARATPVEGSLRPWLYGIATNVLRNASRARRRQSAALARYHAMNGDSADADHAEAVVTALAARGSGPIIRQALAQLSTREREVADLVLVEGLTVRAAASALGIAEPLAKSRLAEARKRLQRLLRTSELSLLQPATGHQLGERPTTAAVKRSNAS